MEEVRKKEAVLHHDIARRFEVPERKVKLAKYLDTNKPRKTTFKMSDSDAVDSVYCICRTSDIERFMIMCDECQEWFHGDCIKITEKEAKHIKYFYCKSCRVKNPFLRIKYRKSKKKDEKERERPDKRRPMKDKKKIDKKEKLKKKISDVHKSASTPALSELLAKSGKYERDEAWEPAALTSRRSSMQEKKHSTIKIYSSDEDDKVDVVVPAPALEKDLEHQKKDAQGEELVKKESLSLVDAEVKNEADLVDKDVTDHNISMKKGKNKTKKRCGKCENCLRKENCGVCDICFDRERFGPASKPKKCRLRRCLNKKSKKSKQKFKDDLKRKGGSKTDDMGPVKYLKTEIPQFTSQNMFRNMMLNDGYGATKQCFGPGCTNSATPSSKYCSEACGRRLARDRLYHILPQRIQQWNSTPTVANDTGRVELERIRSRMVQARNELEALEQKFRKLESIIAAGKSLTIDKKQSDHDEESEGDSDQSIYCVVCGQTVTFKNAIKHMDKCYIKIESQMSFGSVYPTRIEGSQRLFCDVYNEQQQTYCKRLQVLCPEHTKEPKVAEDEVCGCPLSCDVYGPSSPSKPSHFCRLAKRKCNKHFKWETMYRAEVDLQRIRQWLKIDEIFDEERRIKTAMASRAGVVSLLLHQTIVHDPHCADMRTKPSVSKKPAYRLLI
ncbi:CXXC-type zinc finger protein 1-like [Clavelina lepadiformis]|uniref:CXXC-type zinc finger protein 1-like n=1 Tax=Clavelina lepadiformis TaxID=159417 RepID=UPI004041EDF3